MQQKATVLQANTEKNVVCFRLLVCNENLNISAVKQKKTNEITIPKNRSTLEFFSIVPNCLFTFVICGMKYYKQILLSLNDDGRKPPKIGTLSSILGNEL